jgi:predicted CXXCH cytochrome family protein
MHRFSFRKFCLVIFFSFGSLILFQVSQAAEEEGDCLFCHENQQTAGGKGTAHGNYPVVSKSCKLCHQNHDSKNKKYLRDNIHAPVAESDCSSCHVSSANKKNPFALKESLPTLCYNCHDQADYAKKSIHAALGRKESCLLCHEPHASEQKKLMKGSVPDICWSCHAIVKEDLKRTSVHPPFEGGECLVCHTPHSSAQKHLLVDDAGLGKCQTCHTQRHLHSLGVKASKKMVMSNYYAKSSVQYDEDGKIVCSSCHHPHASGQPKLVRYEKGLRLCKQCHSW